MTRRLLGPVGGPIVFLLVAGLVFAGLGWVTVAALRVEEAQRESAARAGWEKDVRSALWQLDGRMLPALGVEDSRPFHHYASFTPGDPAAGYGSPACAPLLAAPLPDWMRLHFQLDADAGWQSPQVLGDDAAAVLSERWPALSLRNSTPARATLVETLRVQCPPRRAFDDFAARDRAVAPPAGVELADTGPAPTRDEPAGPPHPSGVSPMAVPPPFAPVNTTPPAPAPAPARPSPMAEAALGVDSAPQMAGAVARDAAKRELSAARGLGRPTAPSEPTDNGPARRPNTTPFNRAADGANGGYGERLEAQQRALRDVQNQATVPQLYLYPPAPLYGFAANGLSPAPPATNNALTNNGGVASAAAPGAGALASSTPAAPPAMDRVDPSGAAGSSDKQKGADLGKTAGADKLAEAHPAPDAAGNSTRGAAAKRAAGPEADTKKADAGDGLFKDLADAFSREAEHLKRKATAGFAGGAKAAPAADAGPGPEMQSAMRPAPKLVAGGGFGGGGSIPPATPAPPGSPLGGAPPSLAPRALAVPTPVTPAPASVPQPVPVLVPANPGPPAVEPHAATLAAPVAPAAALPVALPPTVTVAHLGPMRPQWVSAADGSDLLVLVRSARLERENRTVYQGVVLDWPLLQAVLKDEVKDRFPDATLLPAKNPTEASREQAMTALPVQLNPGPAPQPPPAGWTPLRLGLVLAWTAAAIAFAAVGLCGWSLIDLSERRIRFVSAVTHELRTPLTSLRLYLDLLLSGMVQDEAKRTEYLATLNAESDRLHRLVDNVLDFARLERRRRGTAVGPVRAADLLAEVRRTWADRCAADGKELVVVSTLPPDQEVRTDAAMVQQIVGNLIDNARKYARGAGDTRIWVWAKLDGPGRVAFEVEDRGPGVPPRERGLIFRPFRRGESADTTAGGAGLGLALSKQWAEVLGGKLTYRPADGGVGSCFRLELPAK